jgi:Protein phosphatase 2C
MIETAVFRQPKDGSTWAEYEDAVACSPRQRRFAVADGASASAFARLWAQLLVRAYVAGRVSGESLESDLHPVQRRWSESVDSRELPWYAAEQARRGAFAALLGVTFTEAGSWSALAVGDCCLFQVRGTTLHAAWPLSEADAFDNRPFLLGSRPSANTQLRTQGAIGTLAGDWQPGDTLLLMSDALAATFLRLSSPTEPLNVLSFEKNAAGFRDWIQCLRADRAIRNDDVSLIWLSASTDAAA